MSCDEFGRHQEAVEAFQQAIRLKPNLAQAHYNLCKAYGNLGRYQEAVDAFIQAIRLKPDFTEAHYSLGLTYLLLDDKGWAMEEYKILKDLNQERANNLFDLILIYQESLKNYQKSLEK